MHQGGRRNGPRTVQPLVVYMWNRFRATMHERGDLGQRLLLLCVASWVNAPLFGLILAYDGNVAGHVWDLIIT